ncbi:hypothetical protein FRB97_002438 [Tulasnella sp. 331]|nr:hypothetical protein FRB97_002438 [Tulasnella sp. 331]
MTIRSIPTAANGSKPDMLFVATVAKCIELCENLVSFTCTAHALLPFILTKLLSQKPRLTEVKLEALTLSVTEATELAKMEGLTHLTLESPSRGALHLLEKWVGNNRGQLTCLSLSNSIDVTPGLLGYSLAHLSNLKSLSITNCLATTHKDLLRQLNQYPQLSLESLALTIYTSTREADALWPDLFSLKHLTIHVRQCGKEDLNPTVKSVLSCVSHAALESLTLRDIDRAELHTSVLNTVIKEHKRTLRKLNFVSFILTEGQIREICLELKELRQLAVFITVYLDVLAAYISKAKRLTTLVDTQSGTGHAARDPSLDSRGVKKLFKKCVGLRTVKTTGRTYTAEWKESGKTGEKELKVTLHRLRQPFVVLREGRDGTWDL